MSDEVTTTEDPELKSQIGKIVAFAVTPLILAASAFIANWAQTAFNADLDGAELAAFLASVLLPIGTAIGVWLFNRGKFEIEKLKQANPVFGPVIQEVVDRAVEGALAKAQEKPVAAESRRR